MKEFDQRKRELIAVNEQVGRSDTRNQVEQLT
jgi:hypothetical protein